MADPTGAPRAAGPATAPIAPPATAETSETAHPFPHEHLPAQAAERESAHDHGAESAQDALEHEREREHEDPQEPPHRSAPERAPVRWGRGALALAVLMIAVLVAALAVDAPGHYLVSTVLAYVANGVSVVALILGIVGIVANRGRGAGIAAVVIAVLGNPLVLLYGLGALA